MDADKIQVGDLWRGKYAKNLLTVCDDDIALIVDIYELALNSNSDHIQTYLTWVHCETLERFHWEINHFKEEFTKIS